MFSRAGGLILQCSSRRQVFIRKEFSAHKFSTYNSAKAAATSISSPLGGLTIELDRIAPRFEVSASQITVIDSPAAFYETLKVRVTLYLKESTSNEI
jgi:CDP-diacylglycerol---glycerol-3-phosphate 3-phosphatidyltransferase